MPINQNIAMGFQQPEIPNQLANYAQMQQILGAREAQQLNQLKIQEAQASAEERNALRQLNPSDPEYENQLARLNPQLAINLRKSRADELAQQTTQAKSEFDLKSAQMKALGTGLASALQDPSDEGLKRALFPLKSMGVKTDTIYSHFVSMPDPNQRLNAIRSFVSGSEDGRKALEFVAPKPEKFDIGGSIVILDMNPNSPTFKQQVSDQTKTMTPGEVSTAATALAGQQSVAATALAGQKSTANTAEQDRMSRELVASANRLSTAKTADSRLKFDQTKFNWEKANPNKTIKEVEQADGTIQIFGIDNRTGIATPVKLAGAPGPAMPGQGRPAVDGGIPLTGKKPPSATAEKTAVSEQQAAYNIGRVLTAAGQINEIGNKDPDSTQPGPTEALASSIGMSGTANLARNANRQIVQGAQRDALDALLYLATGAAYNKEQLQGQMDAYIPAFTDKSEAVAAKKARMANLIQSAKVRAGKAWTPEMDRAMTALTSSAMPNKPAAPSVGIIQDGYRFKGGNPADKANWEKQ